MRLPDFIGFGIPHAGTTWLWHELGQHKEIQLPERKEPCSFIEGMSLKNYSKYFNHIPNNKVTGEFSVRYFRSSVALKRIKRTLPNVKLFCVVRNPIDVAFSYYKSYRFKKKLPKVSFLTAVQKSYSRMDASEFMIADKLNKWSNTFKHVKFLLYDDLLNNPIDYINQVYSYIGVKKWHSNTVNKWKKRPYAAKFGHRVISNITRRELTPLFLEETEKIEKLTGFNLTNWKKIPD